MKRLFLFSYLLLTIVGLSAQTFSFTYEGARLQYTITNIYTGTCEVTDCYEAEGDIIIPNSVQYEGENYGVQGIAARAFSHLSAHGITSVKLQNSVQYIGDYAFSGLPLLKHILIPVSVKKIGESAFEYCVSLSSVNIYSSVDNIGKNCFYGCDSLLEINVSDGNAQYASIDGVLLNKDKTEIIRFPGGKNSDGYIFPNTVETIGELAFGGCSNITNLEIPESVTTISQSAFYLCNNLKSISFPNIPISIGNSAFVYCINLTSIYIPENVSFIGSHAFGYCKKLESIYYNTSNPKCFDENVFTNYSKPTLYLRESAIFEARNINPWKQFQNIEPFDFSGVDEIIANNANVHPKDIFNLNGVKVGNDEQNLPSGIYIIRQGNSVYKKAIK